MDHLEDLTLLDVEALRLVLFGTSVIDWQRLAFTETSEVNRFLELCQFEPESATDQAWMRGVIREAADYVGETFRYRVPTEVAEPEVVQELFLLASGARGPRLRKAACIVLKLCHVLHHIEGRDLFHRLPLAEEAFGAMAEQRVVAVFEQMKTAGLPIREAHSSHKSRASLISKLLQRAETLAGEVYDRTRFRVVVAEREHVLPVLRELTQRLFPFHLVVPGQSRNSLIDFRAICENEPAWRSLVPKLQFGVDFSSGAKRGRKTETQYNAFSGSTYRILKFVVDMPVRIDDALISPEIKAATRARIIHNLVEFQIVDAATAVQNSRGENDHARYKRRQKVHILRRLARGLGDDTH